MSNGIEPTPRLTAEASKSLGWSVRSNAKDKGIVRHFDTQAVARLDPQAAPCLTRQRDLMLAADLHALHRGMIPTHNAASSDPADRWPTLPSRPVTPLPSGSDRCVDSRTTGRS